MAHLIFNKNATNDQGAMVGVKATGVDVSSWQETHVVIEITDNQYNDVRLNKVNPSYDESNNVVFNAIPKPTWDSLEELQEEISGLPENSTKDPEFNAQITALKAVDITGYTFPLTKTTCEIAEENGITWKHRLR